jgi:hypothetical protein
MVTAMRWRGSIVVLLAVTMCVLAHPRLAPAGEIQGRVVVTGEVQAPKNFPITIDQYVRHRAGRRR